MLPEELQAAARELDERTYRQEFQATFETLGAGRVYYTFDRHKSVRPTEYQRDYPLFWSLDFNVDPMCSVIGQIIHGVVHVIDELALPNANTLAACRAFSNRVRSWEPPRGFTLAIYGDASGDSRHSSASRTDWQIVKDYVDQCCRGEFCALYKGRRTNPVVKDRTNCVNAVLRNHAGERRLWIDPRCKQLIRDLEQVCWKKDLNGNSLPELDKSDPMRTHVSDALGYMIANEFAGYGRGTDD